MESPQSKKKLKSLKDVRDGLISHSVIARRSELNEERMSESLKKRNRSGGRAYSVTVREMKDRTKRGDKQKITEVITIEKKRKRQSNENDGKRYEEESGHNEMDWFTNNDNSDNNKNDFQYEADKKATSVRQTPVNTSLMNDSGRDSITHMHANANGISFLRPTRTRSCGNKERESMVSAIIKRRSFVHITHTKPIKSKVSSQHQRQFSQVIETANDFSKTNRVSSEEQVRYHCFFFYFKKKIRDN
ncbi:hypothetical protein RFI_17472 [Reticulomyxa filosa]|uniref:Uncharacterized protein n=1 Tax=Reticulomyxa filosa TaxID=46433 RepID=X6N110_RETFI|nr:hypothetical protein RFI_17472 [Reticulomyxa filosa]|eukprot:ETO19761.1 hypothetical protein RFI_17472 [Reticulomyxa filosa]